MIFANMDFPTLATYGDIELDDLCPTKAPELLKMFQRTKQKSGIETPLMKNCAVQCSLGTIGSKYEGGNTGAEAPNLKERS